MTIKNLLFFSAVAILICGWLILNEICYQGVLYADKHRFEAIVTILHAVRVIAGFGACALINPLGNFIYRKIEHLVLKEKYDKEWYMLSDEVRNTVDKICIKSRRRHGEWLMFDNPSVHAESKRIVAEEENAHK